MRRWLVDTQLIVDWCLWGLADEKNRLRRVENAEYEIRVLKGRDTLDALNRELGKSVVVLATNVVIEVTGVLWTRLRTSYRGDEGEDRLNEKFLRAALRFTDRFDIERMDVTEKDADEELRELNRRNPPKPFDLGDAALLAGLRNDSKRSLLTTDSRLVSHCFNTGRGNVYQFDRGKILDAKGNVLRDEIPKRPA